jgi:hypothetical protein
VAGSSGWDEAPVQKLPGNLQQLHTNVDFRLILDVEASEEQMIMTA